MGELIFFLSLLAIFMSAFFIISLMSTGKLDRIKYIEKQEEIEKGKTATLIIGDKRLSCIIEECYDDDMLSQVIKLRYLR